MILKTQSIYFSHFKCCVKRASNYFYCFNGITVNYLTSATLAICQLDLISFFHAATPVLAPTMFDAPSGPNLDHLCIQQSGTAPFCEYYAELYFDATNLEKGLKNAHFARYWKLPNFSRFDPVYHNIELYYLFMVCPFNTGHSPYC